MTSYKNKHSRSGRTRCNAASHPKRPESSKTLLSELHNLHSTFGHCINF